jgi:hypothetical protein
MTVSSATSRVSYNGDGSTTAFSFPYYFLVSTDLKVYLRSAAGVETLQTPTTHYTVAGAGVSAGGTVTFVTAPASGVTVVIYRDPPITQTTDYSDGDEFPAASHENALDKLTMLIQRIASRFGRVISLAETSSSSSVSIGDPIAGEYLRWNGAGTAIESTSVVTPNGTYAIASQVEAEARTLNNVLMTPLRVGQAIAAVFAAKITATVDNATTNGVTAALKVSHTTSGTPATGIGVGIELEAETTAGNNEVGATIEAVTTDVTAASEDFDLVIKTMAAGAAAAERLRVKSTGEVAHTGFETLPEIAAPSTPSAGRVAVYAKSDGLIYSKDDAGAETLVSLPRATQAQMEAATSGVAVTPDVAKYAPSAAKAWIKFDGAGAAIAVSYNVSSLTDNASGDWTVNFAVPFSSANYAVATSCIRSGAGVALSVQSQLAGACRLEAFNTVSSANADTNGNFAVFYGDQ